MPGDFLNVQPRDFTPKAIPGLSNEAREAVNAALRAMSAWRNEVADTNEKNGKRVVDKMAAAAVALGWPEQIVNTMRTQLQSVADMQIKTLDRMMDAWEEQMKLPSPTTASPSAMLSKLKSVPGLDQNGSWPMNPMQLWMQLAEQSQKSMAEMMSFWSRAGKPH